MAFTPAAHTPYQWDNAPLTDTPLDASHLEASEQDLITYVQSVATALDAFLEGILAPISSPNFAGVPTAPTPAVDDNSTKISTTAYVQNQGAAATPLIDGTANTGVSTRWARGDHVHPTDTSRAPLVSPAFTGTPTAPTPALNDNTTKVATTAYVEGQAATTNPLMDGTAAVGTGTTWARTDHVHPSDTTRAPVASPIFTGAVSASTVGSGYQTKEGTNAKQGTAILAGGLAAPNQTAPSTSTTGGTLAAATYFYKVAATNASGESLASNEQSIVTTGTTSSNTVNWGAVTGATGYKIYRGTATGAESVFYTVGAVTTFLDTGAASTGGTPLSTSTVTVANTSVTANSRVFLTTNVPGGTGTVGAPYVSARTAGTSFVITSTSSTDTSTVAYEIFEPA